MRALVWSLVWLVVTVGLLVFILRPRRVVRRPRRRDSDPQHVQQMRGYKAFLKRCRRGLRFPTAWEKKHHFTTKAKIEREFAKMLKKAGVSHAA